jgi:hypothetical protein
MGEGRDEPHADRALTACLAEFEALRSELLWRIQTREALRVFTATSLATLASFAIQQRNPELLLACAYLGVFGAAAYIHHTVVMTKIAVYIRDVIRPMVQLAAASPCFGWESHHRTDANAIESRVLQYRTRAVANATVFAGSIGIGLVVPGISLAHQLAVRTEPWALAWEVVLWFAAMVLACWLWVTWRRASARQIARPPSDLALSVEAGVGGRSLEAPPRAAPPNERHHS